MQGIRILFLLPRSFIYWRGSKSFENQVGIEPIYNGFADRRPSIEPLTHGGDS